MMPPLRRLARRFGYDLIPLLKSRDGFDRIVRILKAQQVETVIDVGAHRGEYASTLRAHGYTAKVTSIEPNPAVHAKLTSAAANDPNWTVLEPMAASSRNGTAELNISKETDMSSLLAQTGQWGRLSPTSEVIERQEVKTARLDSLFSDTTGRLALKADVQGLEAEVLDGASGLLDRIAVIQLEMALMPVYQGERDYRWMIDHMANLGYDLFLTIPGFFERKLARQLQFDGVFARRLATPHDSRPAELSPAG